MEEVCKNCKYWEEYFGIHKCTEGDPYAHIVTGNAILSNWPFTNSNNFYGQFQAKND